ncbi:MAG: hypothetical protein KDD45_10585, partial [Bdellovibrionales bacterium]|nr:hypothetical protein [Bdellovibrionales bacterium]
KVDDPILKPVRTIYPEFESHELDYEMFAGLVIMQLRENHFERFSPEVLSLHLKELRSYTYEENHIKEALIITAVLPGSRADLSECFLPGSIIDTVNSEKVKTLEQLREALKKSISTKEIAFTLKDGPSTVLSFPKVLEEEPILSMNFKYPLTQTIKNLIKRMS